MTDAFGGVAAMAVGTRRASARCGPGLGDARHAVAHDPLVIIAGALNGAQAGVNSTLSKSLGNPIASALVVYLGGLVTFAVLAPFCGFHLASFGKLRETPWWAMVGGVGGALFIIAMLTAAPKLGAGAFTGLTVTAALITTIAVDHYGWLGVDRHPAGLARLAGGALMIAGVALVAKF